MSGSPGHNGIGFFMKALQKQTEMCGWAGSQGGLGAVGVRMEPCDLSQMKSGRECLRLGDRGVF